MIRILKLALVVLTLNALWRVGSAYWEFYRFGDHVKEIAQFSGGKTDAEVHERVVQWATENSLPVDPAAIDVRRTDRRTYIDVSYVKPVEIVPRLVTRPWPFTVSVDAWTERPDPSVVLPRN